MPTSEYGPPRPETSEHEYTKLRTPSYLRGHANKIIHDLEKSARLYNGKLVRIFNNGGTEVCPTCVDLITGSIVLRNCPDCGGTGRGQRQQIGEYWAMADIAPKYKIPTEFGNVENPGGQKETFVVVGAPLLKDEWLISVVDTRTVYKIYDVAPQLVAMQGIVITQLAACALMPEGSEYYKIITW